MTDLQYPASTSLNVHFGYDSFGRRSAMTDSTGSQSFTYGNLDEVLSVATTYTGLPAQAISYAYYPNGSRQSMTTPAGIFSYSHDAAGRPSSMTNPFSETTSWTYQDNNWLATQTLANGAVATYTYNALGQLTRLLNQISGSTISDFTISYDGAGNRSSVSASSIGTLSLNGSATSTYNTKNELLQELSTRYGGFTQDFGYNSAGNLTTFKGTTKSYNSNNQQTGTGFTYDNNGNPTAYNGVSLSFDPESRLTSYGSVLTAGYRGDGLRAKKQTSASTAYYLYDGTNPIIELDSSGLVTATNTFTGHGLVSRRVGAASVLYAFDSEGNVAQRTDPIATILSDHLFDAHGISLTGSSFEPFGYRAQVGYYTDNETGLQLLTRRYYDPSNGRFLTRDPISYSGGINLYSYVQNNAPNFADPSGLELDQVWRILQQTHGSYPTPSGPGVIDTLLGDGGVFTKSTAEEFFSAKERARQPCKPFGERFWQSFTDTNDALPGKLAVPGTGIITSGKLAEISGEPTLLRWALNGFRPSSAAGGVAVRGGLNFVAVGASYECGIAIGSFIDATGAPCGY